MTRAWIAAICAVMAVSATSGLVLARHSQERPQATYQQAPPDPRAAIRAALGESKKDGKFVLIDFGADWCPDCIVLSRLLADDAVAPFLDANFHVVLVDVGYRDKNLDVAAQYRAPVEKWIPSVVVLDSAGDAVAISGDGQPLLRGFSSASRVTSAARATDLRYYLAQWAPKKRERTLTSFAERGVRVGVGLDRDSSGAAWLAATFDPELPDSYLYGKDLPLEGIEGAGRPTRFEVTSTTGAKALDSAVASRPVSSVPIDVLKKTFPVYPHGAVTLRLPIELPLRGATGRTEVSVTYMACGPTGCLPPVIDKRVVVSVPTR